MSEHLKNCGNCAHSTFGRIPERDKGVYQCFCFADVEQEGFVVQEHMGWNCKEWYARQLVALPPTYGDGCGFPHCPNCNADLDLRCDKCGESPISDGNYYDYCPYCGQRIKWEV